MNSVLENPTLVLDRPCEALDLPYEDEGNDTREATMRLCHSINNKLVPILAYAELGERLSQDEKVQAYCAKIQQSACALRAVIEAASESQAQRHMMRRSVRS